MVMSNKLPPQSVFWDIAKGKFVLVDDLKPRANIFWDVAEAWRWSSKVAEQEGYLWLSQVQLHFRLSTATTSTSAPVSWMYFGDMSWWARQDKVHRVRGGVFSSRR